MWPYFKDFNSWQNKYGYHYWNAKGERGIHGDMEGDVVRIGLKESEEGMRYVVHTVIPHRLIAKREVPREADGVAFFGDHVFILTEENEKTLITMVMHHVSKSSLKTADKQIKVWGGLLTARLGAKNNYFLKSFIPELRKVIQAGK